MKKLLTLLLLTSVFSLSAQIDLKYNLKKGQTFKILSTAEQDIDQEIMGQSMKVKQTYIQGVKYEVVSVFGGNAKINCTFYRTAFDVSSMAMSMSYDSEDESTDENNPLSLTFGSMLNKSFSIQLSFNGKVQSVEGMDAIINDIMDAAGTDENTKAQMQAQLETQFSGEAIGKSLEQGLNFFPPNGKAAEGDEWSFEASLGVYDVNIQNSYSLQSFDQNTATITLNSTIDADNFTQEMNGQEMQMSMKGNQSGEIQIERSTGMIIQGVINQDMEATAAMMGMTVPMKIKSTNTFVRED